MTGCCYVTQDRTLRYEEYIPTVDSLKKRSWRSSYQEGRVGILVHGLTVPHLCAYLDFQSDMLCSSLCSEK